MPVQIISTKPSYVTEPDLRYAKYRDSAVPGEGMLDKISGELFLKRADDGKIVSFHQNKKYTHDLVLELRVLLTANEEFQYPKNNTKGYYTLTDYDLVAINNEHRLNILESNSLIPNDGVDQRNLHFKVSNECNGFFCRPTSRDTDKPVIEYLTNQYNSLIFDYSGGNTDCLAEKTKMDTIETWYDSNAVLHYNLEVTNGTTTKLYVQESYVRINETVCVYFPMPEIDADFPLGYTSATVTITSITYDKLHFVVNHESLFGSSYYDNLHKFLEIDDMVLINNLAIIRFVDDVSDIEIFGNEFITATMDIPYVRRYMSKLAKLKNSSEFIQSTVRPSDDDWGANTVWAERTRDVTAGGNVIDRGGEVDLNELEKFISKGNKQIAGIIVTNAADVINFLSNES